MSIKSEIEELRKLQENGKPGYACGWTDACGMVLSVVDKAKNRLNGKFKFSGALSVYANGGGTNEVVEMTITIAPSTPISMDTSATA